MPLSSPSSFLKPLRAAVAALLLLTACACGSSGKSNAGDHSGTANAVLALAPATAMVTEGRTVQFTLTGPWGSGATWSVLPASAGVIDAQGLFTAAHVPGDCTVVAMWKDDVRYSATAALTVLKAPAVAVLTAPALVTAGQGGYTASTPAQSGCTYAWTLTGGAFTSAPSGASVTFTPGASGSVTLACVVTNAAGVASAPGTTTSAIVPGPATPSLAVLPYFTAGQTGCTAGTHVQPDCTLTWTLTGGTFTSAPTGPWVTFTAGASGTVQLACVATNAAGTASPQGTASTLIVSAPATPAFTMPTYVTGNQGNYSVSTPAQSGNRLTWTIAGGIINAGATGSTVTFTPDASGTVKLTCVATNLAGANSAGGTGSSVIVAAPAIPAIAAPASVTVNQGGYLATIPGQAGCTFAWTLTGGSFTSAATGTSVTFTAGPSGTVQLGCVATNLAGTVSTPGTATSGIVAPAVTPIVTVPAKVTANQAGYSASTPAQAGSTLAWTITGGTITSATTGTSVTFTAGASGSAQLNCIATNAAGTASAQGSGTSTIVVAPSTPVVTTPANVTANQAGYSASTPAQAGSTLAWTITGGSITSSTTGTTVTFTAGASGSAQLNCIATNAAGTASAQGSGTSTIVVAPSTPVVTTPANVTANQAGYAASTPAQAGSTLVWTITGGTITSVATGTNVTFTAGASGTAQLNCIATNAAGTASAQGSGTSTIVVAPSTPVVTTPANVTANQAGYSASTPAQAGSTLAWTITGGTITSAATGTSVTFTAGTSGSAQLNCIATNAAGTASAQGSGTSAIVVAPSTPVVTTPANVTANQAGYTASTPAQAGSTLVWTITGGSITSSTTGTSVTFTAGVSGTAQLNCIATNAAGTASAQGSGTSTIVVAPSTPVVTTPANVTANQAGYTASTPAQAGSTLAWTITGGSITSSTTGTNVTFTAGASGSVQLNCIATNAAGTASAQGSGTSTVVPAPAIPVINAPDNVTANQAGYSANTPAQAGCTFAWTVTGGTITSGTTGNSITFTAGAAGSVHLRCTATNAAGTTSAQGVEDSTIVAAPSTPVVTTPANVTASQVGYTASTPAQAGSTLAWTITGGTITSAATGTSVTFTAGASGSAQLNCVATNAAGTASAQGSRTSTIVAAPSTPVVTTPANITASQIGYTASTPAQAGSTLAWTITGGTITSATTGTSVTFTAGASGSAQLNCVATNAAGTASAQGSGTSTIVAVPSIIAFSVSPGSVNLGSGAILSFTFTGGTGSISPTVGAVASPGTANVAPATTTVYTLTVTNAAGTAATATTTLTVSSAPAPTLTANPDTITVGQGTILAYTFAGGTGAIDQGVGAVIAGGSVTVSPAATTTYTLTVTAADNSTTTATVTVTVKAFVPKFVYVANDADGSISGFTLNNVSGALTSTGAATATGTHARHLATDVQARFVFVVNNSASTISVYGINGTTGALTLKGSPVATASGPWCSSVDPTGQFVYVRCNGKLSAFTLNGSNGALALINTYTTSTGAGDVIVHPSGKYVISTGDTSSKVDVFTADATTGALSNNAAYALMGGTGPRGVAVDPTGQYVFAKAEDNPSYITAYKLDITTGALSTWAGSLSGPYTGFDSWHGMAFSPTLNVLYTTFYNAAQDVAANGINLATGALTPLVGSPYAWFGGSGSDQVAISRDGQWAFATCYGTNRIGASSVNATTGALSSSPTLYTVGSHPVSVLVAGVLQ